MLRSRFLLHSFFSAMFCLIAAADVCAQTGGATAAVPWVATWGSAQTAPYGTETLPAGSFTGSTLREVVHLSSGGTRLRLKISNAFGDGFLVLHSVHIARRTPGSTAAMATSGAIDSGSDRTLLFAGRPAVSIPAGAEYISDAIEFATLPLSDLVVSMEIESAPGTPTLHAGSRATSFLQAGNHASEGQLSSPQTFVRWYFLSDVEVSGSKRSAGALIALGDSITDGHGATTDRNDRWTDVLAQRLNAQGGPAMAVVNEGIGGNRILQDGIGVNAAARFERDVLVQDGAKTLLIFEGINDLGGLDRTTDHPAAVHQALVADLETALHEMVMQAHEHGLRALGATLTPFLGSGYYHPSAATEADRQALNTWTRNSGVFDGVVDFDKVIRDPANPGHLLPSADSGDHLHPGPEGYRRMGQAIPLALLR